MRTFSLIEADPQPGCREIRVEGDLDMAVAHQLQEAFDRVGADCERVLVDLTSCEFIDSTGIATLVQAQRLLAKEGRRLMVCSPHAQVLRVFEVTGLMNGRGLVFESAEDALLAAR